MPLLTPQDTLDIKYRPKTLEDLIGQDHIVAVLKGMFASRAIDRAIMLHGLTGSGKSTVARIIAKYANCTGEDFLCGKCMTCTTLIEDHPDIIEINTANATGVDNIRSLISQAQYMPQTNFRIFILEEFHQASSSAKEALLTEIEESRHNTSVIWIICTTEPEKFKDTFLGRCTKLQIKPIQPIVLAKHLHKIACLEKSPVAEDKKNLLNIANLVSGQPREGLKVLGKVIHALKGGKKLSPEEISTLVHNIIDISSAVIVNNYLYSAYTKSLAKAFKYLDQVVNPEYFLKSVIDCHLNVLRSRIDKSWVPSYPPYANLISIIDKKGLKLNTQLLSDILVDMTKTLAEIKGYAVDAKLLINALTCRLVNCK